MIENKTSLGVLGKVLDILRRNGVVDIPDTPDVTELSLKIVLELSVANQEDLNELLAVVNNNIVPQTDEEAVSVLESFFTSLGKNLNSFAQILNRDYKNLVNLGIEKMNLAIDKIFSETITETDIESLLKKVMAQL